MNATISSIEHETSTSPKRSASLKMPIVCFLVFSITLSAHLLFHFTSREPNAFFAPDGPHYLASTQQLTGFLLGALHGKPDASLLFSRPAAEALAFDGPVVPAIPALVFTALGHIPKATGWRIFVAINAFLIAVCACLVTLLTNKLICRPAIAVAAGLVFGLLPSMLVASGRFCSEIPAAIILLIFVFYLGCARDRLAYAVGAGIAGGLLAVCKPAMVPAVGLALVWTILSSSRKLLLCAVLATCLALTILPWGMYTKATLGRFCITADRWPVYNATVGTDRETDGWTTLHQSDWSIFMSTCDSPAPLFVSQWTTHPQEMATLALRRVTRMWAQPWNNFRRSVFGINVESQRLFYLVLLTAGLFGIGLYLLEVRSKLTAQQRCCGDLCLILLVGHLGYLFFQAIARYALSAVSLVVVFGAFGFAQLRSKPGSFGKRSAFIAGIGAASLLVFVLGADAFTRLNQPKETAYHLSGTDALAKSITLPATKYISPPGHALVLIDGDRNVEQASVAINGHSVPDHPLPLADFSTDLYCLYPSITEHTEYMKLSVDDLRQWRAVAVPIEWLNLPGQNKVTVASTASCTVYADSDPNTRQMLSPRYFAHDQVLNTTSSIEARVTNPITTSGASQSSYRQGTDGSRQAIPGSLRIKLAILCGCAPVKDPTNAPRQFDKHLTPEAFNEMLRDGDSIKINRFLAKYAPYTGVNISVPELAKSSHVRVRVTGLYKTQDPGGSLGMRVALSTGPGKELVLGRCPHYLPATTQWKPFVIEDIVPRGILQNNPNQLSIFLLPYHWKQAWLGFGDEATESRVKDIHVSLTCLDLPDPTFARVFYY